MKASLNVALKKDYFDKNTRPWIKSHKHLSHEKQNADKNDSIVQKFELNVNLKTLYEEHPRHKAFFLVFVFVCLFVGFFLNLNKRLHSLRCKFSASTLLNKMLSAVGQ